MRLDSHLSPALRLGLLGLLLSSAAVASEPVLHHQEHPESSPILASYDFEAPTPSGPDTHWIRQRDGGGVALSDAFRVHGERSLHVSEVPGNRDFAEFLAYFRQRDEGLVFAQFYLLLTDPEQRFNFGLAGPGWFLNTGQHGHAVWLQTDGGVLRHRRADGWEELFAPRPFAWYFIDLVYDVDRGTYALRIHEEGLDRPLVDLARVPSMHGHSGSAVRYLSLIGDLEDEGQFDFFVDDLLIATHPEVIQKPFVAPGRRSFFVERLAVAPRRQMTAIEREDLFWRARQWLDALAGPTDSLVLDRLEAAADEAFLSGHLDLAGKIYRRLGEYGDRDARMLLKLADVAHLEGDVATERRLRESLYGRLDYEDD